MLTFVHRVQALQKYWLVECPRRAHSACVDHIVATKLTHIWRTLPFFTYYISKWLHDYCSSIKNISIPHANRSKTRSVEFPRAVTHLLRLNKEAQQTLGIWKNGIERMTWGIWKNGIERMTRVIWEQLVTLHYRCFAAQWPENLPWWRTSPFAVELINKQIKIIQTSWNTK